MTLLLSGDLLDLLLFKIWRPCLFNRFAVRHFLLRFLFLDMDEVHGFVNQLISQIPVIVPAGTIRRTEKGTENFKKPAGTP